MKNEDGREKEGIAKQLPLPSNWSRFVLLWHELKEIGVMNKAGAATPASGYSSHWDLMLELQESLRTYRLHNLPEYRPNGPLQFVPATRIADHRPVYLDYEGEVSGNRGSVRRIAAGLYRMQQVDGRTRVVLKREETLATLWLDECEIDEEIQLEVWNWAIVHH